MVLLSVLAVASLELATFEGAVSGDAIARLAAAGAVLLLDDVEDDDEEKDTDDDADSDGDDGLLLVLELVVVVVIDGSDGRNLESVEDGRIEVADGGLDFSGLGGLDVHDDDDDDGGIGGRDPGVDHGRLDGDVPSEGVDEVDLDEGRALDADGIEGDVLLGGNGGRGGGGGGGGGDVDDGGGGFSVDLGGGGDVVLGEDGGGGGEESGGEDGEDGQQGGDLEHFSRRCVVFKLIYLFILRNFGNTRMKRNAFSARKNVF